MAHNRLFENKKQRQTGWEHLNHDMLKLIACYLSMKDTVSLAQSCQQLWQPLQPMLNRKREQIFLEAVLDDNRKLVTELLEKYPTLVQSVPPNNMVLESQYTWQKFMAEDALSMAVKRKQIEMIRLLLSYHHKLEQTDELKKAKDLALSAWSFYEMKMNEQEEEEIVIPPAYAGIIQNMLRIFAQEAMTDNKCSVATEKALSSFREMLLPKHAVTLNNYVDIELLLYAAYKMYSNHFGNLLNWDQRSAFCIRVIGFIQSLVTPETAKIFCEGLYYVVEENQEISDRASALKLSDGTSFYRSSREAVDGLGFDFICAARRPDARRHIDGCGVDGARRVGNLMSDKSNKLSELYAAAAATATLTRSNK